MYESVSGFSILCHHLLVCPCTRTSGLVSLLLCWIFSNENGDALGFISFFPPSSHSLPLGNISIQIHFITTRSLMQLLLLSFRCRRFELKENYPLLLFQENNILFYISIRAGMRSEMNSLQCLHISLTNALGGSFRPTLQFVWLEKPDDIKRQSARAPTYLHPWHSHAGLSGGSRHLPCSFQPFPLLLGDVWLHLSRHPGHSCSSSYFLLSLHFKNYLELLSYLYCLQNSYLPQW